MQTCKITEKHRILSCAKAAAADAAFTAAGGDLYAAMERAGRALFDAAAARSEQTVYAAVAVVCGAGNNGGDGYICARLLHEARAFRVTVVMCAEPKSPLCVRAHAAARAAGVQIICPAAAENYSFSEGVIVDAVFGTGFKGAMPDNAAGIIKKINAAREQCVHIISADIPSGLGEGGVSDAFLLNCRGSGTFMPGSDACVRADETIVFSAYKFTNLLAAGRDLCGQIVVADVGVPVPEGKDYLAGGAVFCKRPSFSHKGSYPGVYIAGGCAAYRGAAILAARAAFAGGAGLVRIAADAEGALVYPAAVSEATLSVFESENGFIQYAPSGLERESAHFSNILVGTGMGENPTAAAALEFFLSTDKTVLIDADGLNTLSKDLSLLKKKKARVILTPHMKEFERLSGVSVADCLADPVRYARGFAREYSVTLLLKNNSNIITDGDILYVTVSGTPALAKGGSGDVLAGLAAAVCDGGAETAAAVSYVHGLAGAAAGLRDGEISTLPSAVIECLPSIIKQMTDDK